MIDTHTVYTTMFYALDAAYEDNKNEELRTYLTSANPFLFTDKQSADPTVYEEFKTDFEREETNKKSPSNALIFVRNYLKNQNETLLQSFDSVVNEANWASALEN